MDSTFISKDIDSDNNCYEDDFFSIAIEPVFHETVSSPQEHVLPKQPVRHANALPRSRSLFSPMLSQTGDIPPRIADTY